MQPLLQSYSLQTLAISKDTVAQAQQHRQRDGLTFPLLTDPELKIHRQFGLVHQNGLEFKTFFMLGIPLGWPVGFRRMAIPTTFLVDAQGIIRWIDQADDYRLRGNRERIEQALQQVFGEDEGESPF